MNFLIRKLTFPFACLLTVFVLSSMAYSQETQIRIVYTKWFPYTYQKNGTPSGFEIDIFNSVLKKMNIKAQFKKYPWKRCLKYIKRGKADALISMLKTPEREQYTYYPGEHISISKTMFFQKAGSDITFNGSFEELRGYIIGVILGFSYGDMFDQAKYLQKDESIDTDMLINKLLKNRNDLAAENQAVVNATAFQLGVKEKIRFLAPPIHSQKLYVGFSKANKLQKMCHEFSILLREFKKSEQYKVILATYGIKPSDMMDNTH